MYTYVFPRFHVYMLRVFSCVCSLVDARVGSQAKWCPVRRSGGRRRPARHRRTWTWTWTTRSALSDFRTEHELCPEPQTPNAKRLVVGFCSLARYTVVLLVVTSTRVRSPHSLQFVRTCLLSIVCCSHFSSFPLPHPVSSHSAYLILYSLSFACSSLEPLARMQSSTLLTRIVCSYYSFCS